MKEKYFDVDELYVGYIGKMSYLGEKEGFDWKIKKSNSHVIYKKHLSESLDNCHEGKNVFTGEKYYFFNEIKRKSTFNIVRGNYIIMNNFPLKLMFGDDQRKVSMIELKGIESHFNLVESLSRRGNDMYLILLEQCLDDIDIMEEGKVKEYYMWKIFSLITRYNSVLFEFFDQREYNNIIKDINSIRYELEKEKEICVKKVKKVK